MDEEVLLRSETIRISDLELRIKEVAKELSLKMKDIAAAVEVDNTYISRIASGRVTPNVKMIQKIAEFMKVPVHRLIVAPKGYSHFYDEHGKWLGIREI